MKHTLKINKSPKVFSSVTKLFSTGKSEEIDRELPFAVMMFTAMTASGITLYESWKKMQKVNLLPNIQKDATDVVRKVEVLGHDPLTVVYQKSEKAQSKLYRDFLAGFVSSVRSGSNVMNFLKSKMRSILEVQSNTSNRSIERLGTLVEAYAIMMIVTLCVYILQLVISQTSIFQVMQSGAGVSNSSPFLTYVLIFLVLPTISIVFMVVAHLARKSNFVSISSAYRQAFIPGLIVAVFFALVMFFQPLRSLMGTVGMPAVVTACLVAISILPAIIYHRIAAANFAAEEAMPSFLRDVTEARKIGLSPEKSIIHASKRTGYGEFSKVLGLVRSQIEWGVPLKKIYANIKRSIQSWPVLIHFFILIETIETGGGSPSALEILADYSEKNKDIETNKRSMLKPYLILAFVWSVLIALTTTIVALTMFMLTQISLPGMGQVPVEAMQNQINLFSIGIILQCWMSGFFIGKINDGTFAAGFKHSAMLAATAFASLLLSQNLLSGLFVVAHK